MLNLNTMICNWVIGCVQQAMELHIYPNKGDRIAALQSMVTDPSVISHMRARVNIRKRELKTLKYHCNNGI